MSRFPTVAPETMTAEQKAVYDEIAGGPRGGVRGPFPALLHHPSLARGVQQLGEQLRYRSRLPEPLKELAIIITARHWSAQYEWYAHARLARQAGLADAIIDAVAADRAPVGMSSDETLVYNFATEILQRTAPSEANFQATQARFGYDGVLDIVALCGYYTTVALILNTAQVGLPEGATPLPARAR